MLKKTHQRGSVNEIQELRKRRLVAGAGFEPTNDGLATGVGFELIRGLDSQRVVDNNMHHRFLIEGVGSPIRQIWKGGTNDEQHSDFCRLKGWG